MSAKCTIVGVLLATLVGCSLAGSNFYSRNGKRYPFGCRDAPEYDTCDCPFDEQKACCNYDSDELGWVNGGGNKADSFVKHDSTSCSDRNELYNGVGYLNGFRGLEGCARRCLADQRCVSFEWRQDCDDASPCHLSSTCNEDAAPTPSNNYDLYIRVKWDPLDYHREEEEEDPYGGLDQLTFFGILTGSDEHTNAYYLSEADNDIMAAYALFVEAGGAAPPGAPGPAPATSAITSHLINEENNGDIPEGPPPANEAKDEKGKEGKKEPLAEPVGTRTYYTADTGLSQATTTEQVAASTADVMMVSSLVAFATVLTVALVAWAFRRATQSRRATVNDVEEDTPSSSNGNGEVATGGEGKDALPVTAAEVAQQA